MEETLEPGASVSRVARRYDVNANQVFHWRKLYHEGRLGTTSNFLPVRVADEQRGEAVNESGFIAQAGTMVQTTLQENPFSGQVFVFRGRRGDLIKLLWWSGDGLCLFAKRLERGRFVWPQATSGTVALTPAQLSMLLEGIDWRRPVRSYEPQMAV